MLIGTLGLFTTGCTTKSTSNQKSSSSAKRDIKKSKRSKTDTKKEISELFSKTSNKKGYYYELFVEDFTSKETISGSKIWMQGEKIKMEMKSEEGERFIMINDLKKGESYNYQVAENTAIKTKYKTDGDSGLGEEMVDTPTDIVNNVSLEGLIDVEDTTYDGKEAKLVTTKWIDESRAETVKMWVLVDSGFPVKTEFISRGKTQMVIEYKNFKTGPFPAETFEIPDGVKIIEMDLGVPPKFDF